MIYFFIPFVNGEICGTPSIYTSLDYILSDSEGLIYGIDFLTRRVYEVTIL